MCMYYVCGMCVCGVACMNDVQCSDGVVYGYGMCVCVCVCERERETERQRDRETERQRGRERELMHGCNTCSCPSVGQKAIPQEPSTLSLRQGLSLAY